MKDRKQHVIKMAHQLFIEKGFQSTSIQDILDYSGIAKGTFYNYFPSKNDLLIAIFKSVYLEMERERDQLLLGKDPSNIDIFIKQMVLQLQFNRANNLITLFDEVLYSNDPDLKEFIRKGHFRILRWYYQRFIELFGEDKKPYLLDCAIMFNAILQHHLKLNVLAYGKQNQVEPVVKYCVDRIVAMVHDLANADVQLIPPDLLDRWYPDQSSTKNSLFHEFEKTIYELKSKLTLEHKDYEKSLQLLEFIQQEIFQSKEPRKFLLESALQSLKTDITFSKAVLKSLESLISSILDRMKSTSS
ncbi:bile-regulated transcriptional regulator BrtA [Bacillus carboniphilus]|uniref:Bile-regulated transcriptional regulator BrtA n=1 Tax=Bacillus carboniphilus TaxID=86663 RepID=A0ABP3GA15_9BACI